MNDPVTVPPLHRTARSTLERHPERGSFDRALAHAILDEGLVAHVGLTTPDGPIVVPMVYARDGDTIYLHGSVASRLLHGLAEGLPLCLTVTLLDGLVLARSAFYHSAYYRSVMVHGVAEAVTDPDEARLASNRLVDHIAAGRSLVVRPPSDKELRATRFSRLALDEASVKTRSGPPGDAPEDVLAESPWAGVWAGVIPLALMPGKPETEVRVPAGIAPPLLEPRPGGSKGKETLL